MTGTPDIVQIIENAWGWVGLKPCSLVETNAFGNVLVVDVEGRYWRICPEELSCKIVAEDDDTYTRLRADPDFIIDWDMERLREVAQNMFGPTTQGRCYCLKIPAVLGGEYSTSNIGAVSLAKLLSFSGDLALQIKDLPEGVQIKLQVVD